MANPAASTDTAAATIAVAPAADVAAPAAAPTAETAAPSEVFLCKASGADGRGLYTQEGFVVLKGSIGRRENVPSIVGTPGEKLRTQLLESKVMRVEGDKVVFLPAA